MGVIFDEVTVTVDAQQASGTEADAATPPRPEEQQADELQRSLRRVAERDARLRAD